MNLEKRVSVLEEQAGARRGNVIHMTDAEHAAFGLSRMPLLSSYDAEYAPRVSSFMRLYSGTLSPRQADPEEVMAAMRNTVRGDADRIAADRQRYRALIDSVFERCGFNPNQADLERERRCVGIGLGAL